MVNYKKTHARKPHGPLRKGWTTGSCATAAATAAWQAIETKVFPKVVSIFLPNGQTPEFELLHTALIKDTATVGVIKDAGDDPDITHGAEIIVTVTRCRRKQGVRFFAGEGVGTVTLPGLPLNVGEPAINPKPREMIIENLRRVSQKTDINADITISIKDGERLAKKTMNGRLGIKGGLSILGTTGIVVPYSCASWIHSIHRGIDVARAKDLSHIAAATGATSENSVQSMYNLPDVALIEMGDFVGGMLKYLRTHPIDRLTISGGFAKLAKLAQGEMDLHSSRSQVDMDLLKDLTEGLGASNKVIDKVKQANTAFEIYSITSFHKVPLANLIAMRAREVALATVAGGINIEVLIFNREGQLIGSTGVMPN